MLFDSAGRPVTPERKHEMIEDCKSFSYRLSLKNADGSPAYESADFFQSRKYRAKKEDEDEAAREAFEWCFEEVSADIAEFKERRARKQAMRAQRSVA